MSITIRRPFPADRAADLWRWLNSPRDPNFDDFGPATKMEFARDLVRRLKQERTWAILLDGEVVGYLAFVAQSPIFGTFHGLVIDPQYRHLGIGTEAVHSAIREVHAEGFQKLMVWTFADNDTIARLFMRLGFEEEGYLVGATRRHGEPLSIRVMCLPGLGNWKEV